MNRCIREPWCSFFLYCTHFISSVCGRTALFIAQALLRRKVLSVLYAGKHFLKHAILHCMCAVSSAYNLALVGGPVSHEGRVQIRPGYGYWGAMCSLNADFDFRLRAADVICQEMNFGLALRTVSKFSRHALACKHQLCSHDT